ncbi:MAG: hypothetical protein ACKVKG_19635, partial [Alphaproteobacteria bacterium]
AVSRAQDLFDAGDIERAVAGFKDALNRRRPICKQRKGWATPWMRYAISTMLLTPGLSQRRSAPAMLYPDMP